VGMNMPSGPGQGWLDWGLTSINTNIQALIDPKECPLASFLGSSKNVFRCPADKYASAVQRSKGWAHRARSVAMNAFSGRIDDPSGIGIYKGWEKTTNPSRRSPSDLFVLLDEHPDSINDAYYIAVLEGHGGPYAWCDVPATYHNGACGFAFLDGHSEIKKWTGLLSSPGWMGVEYRDRHAGALVCDGPSDRRDIDWAKDRQGDWE